MSFTNATFLYALLLAAVPVIIHLFGIKKPVKEVFAPLPVILKIRKKIIRRKRIHSLVLLLLRVLFIVLLVLSFSGLFINYRSSTQKASDGCLFLVDNSPSSAVNTERGPLLKLILTEIEKYIAEKKDSCGKFTVYTLSDGKRFEILSEGVTNDKIENRISTGYRPVSIERELTEILALEREKKYEEIVLFSDMYSHFVNNHDTALQIIRDNNIEVADINIPPASNVFISQLRVEDIGGKGIRLIA
ncbi:MAG: BatA domain-containing protein, partial [Deltaproteobacteria bacterium]|nr:BatA domain-containing protein [Deltaproteobacteria bacterium]